MSISLQLLIKEAKVTGGICKEAISNKPILKGSTNGIPTSLRALLYGAKAAGGLYGENFEKEAAGRFSNMLRFFKGGFVKGNHAKPSTWSKVKKYFSRPTIASTSGSTRGSIEEAVLKGRAGLEVEAAEAVKAAPKIKGRAGLEVEAAEAVGAAPKSGTPKPNSGGGGGNPNPNPNPKGGNPNPNPKGGNPNPKGGNPNPNPNPNPKGGTPKGKNWQDYTIRDAYNNLTPRKAYDGLKGIAKQYPRASSAVAGAAGLYGLQRLTQPNYGYNPYGPRFY